MRYSKGLRAIVAALAVSLCAVPSVSLAANTTWSQDTTLSMSGSGISLTILSGSKSDSLVVGSTNFTVNVASGDSFTVRYPAPNPGTLANNGGLSDCNLVSSNNEATVTGSSTVTFTPTTTLCGSSTPTPSPTPSGGGGGGGTWNSPTSITMVRPNGGEVLTAGTQMQVIYSTGGGGVVDSVKISFSSDGGISYTTLVESQANTGLYLWTVPFIPTFYGRIRVEAKTGNSVVATSVSGANFRIQLPPDGTTTTTPVVIPYYPVGSYDPVPLNPVELAAPLSDPNVFGTYSVAGAVSSTPTIDIDKGIVPPPFGQKLPCIGGTLIKMETISSVYYCGKDGKRYVFMNEGIYFSWFKNFNDVRVISAADMAAVPMGGNVLYRPGKTMIKIQTDPKVYAIARGGLLRWVKTESTAKALYGAKWNQEIDDVPDSYFFNFKIGEPIE